jgi:hypothetical protein
MPTGEDVEKLLYVIWKRPEGSVETFKRHILGGTATKLLELGARGLSVNLADELAVYAQGMRITRMEQPMVGTISIWLDTSLSRHPVEEVIASATERSAGYLVLESVPVVNTIEVVPLGERTPGITTVAFLQKPVGMTYEAWREQWQGHHTKVAIETQSTFLYIQNVVVRPLTDGAPPWTAIVEEGFPPEAATDPMVFYDAGGSREKLEENQRRMMESCAKFIDFETLESHPMSSYVLKE